MFLHLYIQIISYKSFHILSGNISNLTVLLDSIYLGIYTENVDPTPSSDVSFIYPPSLEMISLVR